MQGPRHYAKALTSCSQLQTPRTHHCVKQHCHCDQDMQHRSCHRDRDVDWWSHKARCWLKTYRQTSSELPLTLMLSVVKYIQKFAPTFKIEHSMQMIEMRSLGTWMLLAGGACPGGAFIVIGL